MEQIIKKLFRFLAIPGILLLLITSTNSCKKDHDDNNNNNVSQHNFTNVKLVATNSAYNAAMVDPMLINAWGMAFTPSGNIWVSSTDAGVSVVYDQAGAQVIPPVAIPSATSATGGAATGQVYNGTADFVIANGSPAKFIFAGEDGVISAWNNGIAAERKVDSSSTSGYTGLALAANGGNNFLYASNFLAGKIDVFDKNFAAVSMTFADPSLPVGYSPFNIQLVGSQLFVLYARLDESTGDEVKGAGLGYVDIYNTDGSFVKRFASQGVLNAPWGVAHASANFLGNSNGGILIGNFGDGTINAYDDSGNFISTLKFNGGETMLMDGLWAIGFAPGTSTTIDPDWLFYTAGSNDETEGVFGYVKR